MKLLLVLSALAGLLPPGLLSAPARPVALSVAGTAANAAAAAEPAAAPAAGPSSLEALVLQSLEALAAGDSAALNRLAVDRGEFLEVYPYFASDTASARRDFATGYFLADNRKLMRRILEQSGGHSRPLIRFTVMGPVQRFGGAELHRGLRIWIARDTSEAELKFLKSAVRIGPYWKIWGFSDD